MQLVSHNQLKDISSKYDPSRVNLYAIAFVREFYEENKRGYGKKEEEKMPSQMQHRRDRIGWSADNGAINLLCVFMVLRVLKGMQSHQLVYLYFRLYICLYFEKRSTAQTRDITFQRESEVFEKATQKFERHKNTAVVQVSILHLDVIKTCRCFYLQTL